MKMDLEEEKKVQDICRRYEIRVLAVFGSALTNTARDIDFAIFTKKRVSAENLNKLKLISELESVFKKKADIVIVNPASSTTLLYEICRNSLLLYEDEAGSFQEERSIAFRKYADTFKFRGLREKSIKNFVKGVKVVS